MKIFGQLPSKGWQRYVYAFLLKTRRLALTPSMMVLLLATFYSTLNAQIVINELLPNGTVEIKNIGSSSVDVADYWLCDFPAYEQIGTRNIICGNTLMAPGEILTVDNFNFVSADDGEMGIYTNSSFSNPNSIIDYVEWGTAGHTRASVAIAAGIWSPNSFVPAFADGQSLAYSGSGDLPSSWSAGTSTICEENDATGTCEVEGGAIALDNGATETSICVDGNADPLNVTVTGSNGQNGGWIITDDLNNILALPQAPPFDLDGAGVGTCIIWYIRYEDGLTGQAMGNNLSDLDGCFDLSNGINVIREAPDGGTVSLTDGATAYTGTAGDIVFDVSHTTSSPNLSYWYIITDADDNILTWLNSANGNTLDLSGAPAGECHVWGWNYRGLGDPVVGENISTLADDDCEAISDNWITVTRLEPTCEVEGGAIALDNGTTETSICVDGNADPLNVTVTGSNGQNGGWIITDDLNNILALPQAPPFDLDGAGVGTCIIWYIRYEDGLTGQMMGNNLSDLDGSFDLSNGVYVIREAPDGGEVSLIDGSFDYTGCAGDIVFDVDHTTASPNLSYWYIITDDNDNILAWLNSANGNTLDLSGAPAGECHVWGWNYRGLGDPVVGEHISTLDDDDCESISENWITVTRLPSSDPACGGPAPTNQYVLVGIHELDVEKNIFHSGGVGVIEEDGKAEVSEESYITVDGTFINAPEIEINSGAKVNNACAVAATPELPECLINEADAGSEYRIKVDKDEVVTLDQPIYEKIDVRSGATIIFSGNSNVYIEDFKSRDEVTILFDQCTNLIIKDDFILGERNSFNPDEENVFVFAEDDATINRRTQVYGVIYAKDRFRVEKSSEDNPTELHGLFIGNQVRSRDNAMYYQQSFSSCSASVSSNSETETTEAALLHEGLLEQANLLDGNQLEAIVYPNPAKDVAYLNFTKEVDETATLQVYNSINQEVLSAREITLSTQALELDISKLSTGIYYVVITPENGKVMNQRLVVEFTE